MIVILPCHLEGLLLDSQVKTVSYRRRWWWWYSLGSSEVYFPMPRCRQVTVTQQFVQSFQASPCQNQDISKVLFISHFKSLQCFLCFQGENVRRSRTRTVWKDFWCFCMVAHWFQFHTAILLWGFPVPDQSEMYINSFTVRLKVKGRVTGGRACCEGSSQLITDCKSSYCLALPREPLTS